MLQQTQYLPNRDRPRTRWWKATNFKHSSADHIVKAQGFAFFGLVLRQVLRTQTTWVLRMLLDFIDNRLRNVALVKRIDSFFGYTLQYFC
jgi:hypothetical protein